MVESIFKIKSGITIIVDVCVKIEKNRVQKIYLEFYYMQLLNW